MSDAFRLRSEAEIMKDWKSLGPPLVSICCVVFNHAEFIEMALGGVLAQETTFPFEVIIHDDASTDTTATIAQSFADLYPGIVRLVVQERNQYSRGAKVSLLAFGYATGAFVALCEGDDYWTDPRKLQIQIAGMMLNPDCDISFHSAVCIDASGMSSPRNICSHSGGTSVIPAEQVIRNGGGGMPTASLIVRRSVFDNMPHWFNQAPVGDYFLQCLGAFRGGALYIDRNMSVYRMNTPGSWTVRNTRENKLGADLISQLIECCHLLNSESDYKFTRAIHACIGRHYLSLAYRSVEHWHFVRGLIYGAKCARYYLAS